ncbi:MAG: phytoene desaturase family protein [Planctomycetota bacterium]
MIAVSPTSDPTRDPNTASSRRVAVVGAGPGGLSAAMLLAASGCRVTVFESRSEVGGRTSRVEATGDNGVTYRFDRGPTFFLMPYVLGEIFAAIGERLEDHATFTRLDPMYRLIIGRNGQDPAVVDATQDIAEMARRIGQISPSDGAAFERFIVDQRAKLRLSEPILRSPMRSPLDLVNLDAMKVLPMLKPHKSVHQLLGEYFTDEHVKLAVSFQSKYLGMSPFECPSLFTILPLIEYEYGVWHPDGGCHGLCESMAAIIERHGADVRLGTPVDEITFTGKRADGVIVNGEREAFDAVVVNADTTWALKNLIPQRHRTSGPRRGYADATLDAKRYSCSTYMLYLGIEGGVDLPHHTIHTSASYAENLRDITERGRLSEDPSIYLCNPSVTDPTLAPEGHSSLYVLVPTPNTQPGTDGVTIDWAKEAPALRERAFAQMERVFGLADIRDRVRAEIQITPADWEAMGINHGATFNLAHNLTQMLHWRPQNRLKGFENLYLVGGGTHPGSGLPTIFLSSQISTRLVCDDLGIPCPLDASPGPIDQFTPAAMQPATG